MLTLHNDTLQHECVIAMISVRKPLSYYKEQYGTAFYGLNKLYLLMEKQHNRGQEGAGLGCVKLNASPGTEFIFRERGLGTGAIQEIFGNVRKQLSTYPNDTEPTELPFIGDI